MLYNTKFLQTLTSVWLTLFCFAPEAAHANFVFNGCSKVQENEILDAYSLAFSRIKDAEDFVSDNEIYDRWFGEWNNERAAAVIEQIYAMTSAALIGTPEFTCLGGSNKPQLEDAGCSNDRIAFFHPQREYHIYLCEGFWTVGAEHPELDRTGVLIHELSHLSFDASTLDHCYAIKNRDGCMELAETDPDSAVRSADNFRMFVYDVGRMLGNF